MLEDSSLAKQHMKNNTTVWSWSVVKEYLLGTLGCEEPAETPALVCVCVLTNNFNIGWMIYLSLRILGLSIAGVGPSIAGVRALKTLCV